MMSIGLIHLYCGNGKGKTTAALGLAVRCAGHGGRILFSQFLKTKNTGELASLQSLNIPVLRSKGLGKFTFQMTSQELAFTKKEQTKLFHEIVHHCHHQQFDMLILDEIVPACRLGLIDEDMLISFLRTKPLSLEVIMTGRGPSQRLLDAADYVSEVKKIKHPFDRGISARQGIEE